MPEGRASLNSLPPQGLAGLFQIKSSGYLPEPNDHGLQFVFDATDYYLRGQENIIFGNATTGALGISPVNDAGTGTQWTVPAAKGWLVTGCRGLIVTAGTDYRRCRVVTGPVGAANMIPLTDEFNNNPLTAAVASRGLGLLIQNKPVLMGPGYAVNLDTMQIVGVAVNCNVSLRYYEFPWS